MAEGPSILVPEGTTPAPVFGMHRHIALIYDGPGDNAAATGAFVREGLQRGHLCLYVHDDDEQGLMDALAASGIDAPSAVAKGHLEIGETTSAFIADGRFDPRAMIAKLQALSLIHI